MSKDFDRAVADQIKDIKNDFTNKPHVDQSVREGVNRDLDQAIERREKGDTRTPWPLHE